MRLITIVSCRDEKLWKVGGYAAAWLSYIIIKRKLPSSVYLLLRRALHKTPTWTRSRHGTATHARQLWLTVYYIQWPQSFSIERVTRTIFESIFRGCKVANTRQTLRWLKLEIHHRKVAEPELRCDEKLWATNGCWRKLTTFLSRLSRPPLDNPPSLKDPFRMHIAYHYADGC